MSVVDTLKRVHLLANLTEEELNEVAATCTRQTVAANELIMEQNTVGDEMYIIADGAVEVFIKGIDDERSLVVLGRGQMIGEMALIDQGYRSASVRATAEGAELLRIESDDFHQLCQNNTHIGFVVMRNMAIELAFKMRHSNLAQM